MNKEVADKWIAALRSGEYQQTEGKLCGAGGFCCLGVLCDLYEKEQCDTDDGWRDGRTHPPVKVVKWSGMQSDSPPVRLKRGEGRSALLMPIVDVNDLGTPFSEIADMIEAQWESL